MTAKTPVDKIAEQMQESEALSQGMQKPEVPYRKEILEALSQLSRMNEGVARIVERWQAEHLEKAKSYNKSNASDQDYEDYSKSIIFPAEMIRRVNFSELAHRLYGQVIRITDSHCQNSGIDLHRGALYANYAITHLELGHFEIGISWLLAAAEEDVRFKRVAFITDSYAWSEQGIYGQWVKSAVLQKLPPGTSAFVAKRLGIATGLGELIEMLRVFAGNGDLNLLRGIVEYETVRGRADYMGHSVRFTCLRDLATLFEVLLKRIGEKHNDPKVRSAFGGSPTLAQIIHFMHYPKGPKNNNRYTLVVLWLIE